ncbi:universal stress protein [Secundilactobacillus similis]|uniref:UspA domain-containing protein n=1 Tax=Secundilactobacillus similis DSM 23365 = JCM 2765 TaxID=1423804 RepID=A0A0R2F9H5_9LACO|nr:universal stress protein [Secundilactobacillus similis]KRN24976.1 hypothetical protein FD14_GL000446 [Secundilactobacillus similis DSM 23365 = JCM 2765]
MTTGNYIVVALENSQNAHQIFNYALQLAKDYNKSVYGIYIINTVRELDCTVDQREFWIDSQESLAKFNMEKRSQIAVRQGQHFISSITYGDPAVQIAKYVNLDNVCQLVMGRIGDRNLADDELGHKVASILKGIKKPVTLV